MKWISEGGPRALEHLPGLNPGSPAPSCMPLGRSRLALSVPHSLWGSRASTSALFARGLHAECLRMV